MKSIKEKVLKRIKNLKKLQDLFNANSKVIFGNQEDIDSLTKDFEKAIDLTLKEVEHKHQVSMECARESSAEKEKDRIKAIIKVKIGQLGTTLRDVTIREGLDELMEVI